MICAFCDRELNDHQGHSGSVNCPCGCRYAYANGWRTLMLTPEQKATLLKHKEEWANIKEFYEVILYRPSDNAFLDDCCPQAFWKSNAGIKRDFPEVKEVKGYNKIQLENYCAAHNLSLEQLKELSDCSCMEFNMVELTWVPREWMVMGDGEQWVPYDYHYPIQE